MITSSDTTHAMCELVKKMGGKCYTYRDYWNFLQEHHVDTSQFPLALGYFSFEQYIDEMIDEEECIYDTMDDILEKASRVTNITVAGEIRKAVRDLNGSCHTLLESVKFLHDHDFDFSQIELPKGCKNFDEYERYLVESDKLCREMEHNIPPNVPNDPNVRFFDY